MSGSNKASLRSMWGRLSVLPCPVFAPSSQAAAPWLGCVRLIRHCAGVQPGRHDQPHLVATEHLCHPGDEPRRGGVHFWSFLNGVATSQHPVVVAQSISAEWVVAMPVKVKVLCVRSKNSRHALTLGERDTCAPWIAPLRWNGYACCWMTPEKAQTWVALFRRVCVVPLSLLCLGCPLQAPSWLAWFVVALPVALVGNLACWGLLLAAYRPGKVLKEVRRLPDTSVRASPGCQHPLAAAGLLTTTSRQRSPVRSGDVLSSHCWWNRTHTGSAWPEDGESWRCLLHLIAVAVAEEHIAAAQRDLGRVATSEERGAPPSQS